MVNLAFEYPTFSPMIPSAPVTAATPIAPTNVLKVQMDRYVHQTPTAPTRGSLGPIDFETFGDSKPKQTAAQWKRAVQVVME